MTTIIRQCMNPFPTECIHANHNPKLSGSVPYLCGRRHIMQTKSGGDRIVVPDSSCPWCVVYRADDQERRAIMASMMNIVASTGCMITGYREKLNETEPDAE